MSETFNIRVDTDKACEEDENVDPANIEPDSLTEDDLSRVFDLDEIMEVRQIVCKSFSD
ncbi:hypothetical protein ACN6UQ_001684 [Cronobacter muytjensii]